MGYAVITQAPNETYYWLTAQGQPQEGQTIEISGSMGYLPNFSSAGEYVVYFYKKSDSGNYGLYGVCPAFIVNAC